MFSFIKTKKAIVLYIHGFAAKPNDRDILKQYFTSKGLEFKSINFFESDFDKKNCFLQIVEYCDKYISNILCDNIILYGHSMGGAICSMIYEKNKNKVKAIILESPLNSSIYKRNIKQIKNAINNFKVKPNIKNVLDVTKNKLHNFSLLKELICKETIQKIDDNYNKITCPSLVLLGENDYIVPSNYSIDFFKQNNIFDIENINDSFHNPVIENNKCSLEKIDIFIKKIK